LWRRPGIDSEPIKSEAPPEYLGTSISVDDSDKKTVALTEISKAKAADVKHQAGR
jgi:hypothetical protein